MATGLLMLVINKATKIQDLLMSEDKQYVGTMHLGKTTSTQDKEGEVLEENEVPELTEDQLREALDVFLGDFEQIPPMVSAIKKDVSASLQASAEGERGEKRSSSRFGEWVSIDSYRAS